MVPVGDNESWVGSVIVALKVIIQPTASVTVKSYVPTINPVMSSEEEVNPEGPVQL